MSIGHELFAVSEIIQRGGDPEDWKYADYFALPGLQPTAEAFKVFMEYEDFWLLEPPVLAVHVADIKFAGYYRDAVLRSSCQSLVTFGPGYSDSVMSLESLRFTPRPGEEWIIPHMMSFCDQHIISDSPDSWWGAMLSDNLEVIYPVTYWDDVPSTWQGIEL